MADYLWMESSPWVSKGFSTTDSNRATQSDTAVWKGDASPLKLVTSSIYLFIRFVASYYLTPVIMCLPVHIMFQHAARQHSTVAKIGARISLTLTVEDVLYCNILQTDLQSSFSQCCSCGWTITSLIFFIYSSHSCIVYSLGVLNVTMWLMHPYKSEPACHGGSRDWPR